MIVFNFNATASAKVFNMSGDFGVRRIICTSNSSSSSSLQNGADITFESYYGYPKLSDFSVNQFGYGVILVDVVPESSVNDNYFKEII